MADFLKKIVGEYMGFRERSGLADFGAAVLLVGMVGCASASGGLNEAVELFNEGKYDAARDKGDEVAKSWPDAPEAAAAKELAALAELALSITATGTEDFDKSLEHAREYASRSSATGENLLSEKAGSQESICPSDVCDHKLKIPSTGAVSALAAVEYVAKLSDTVAGKTGEDRDAALVSGAIRMVNNPAGEDAAGGWLKTQTCDAFADWSKWDECKNLTVSGKTLSEASDSIKSCKDTAILGGGCEGHDLSKRTFEVVKAIGEAQSDMEDLPPTEVCSLVPAVNALFSEDEPKLKGKEVPEIGPAQWWSTFKAESEPVAKLRMTSAITIAATEKHKALVQFAEKTLPAAGFVPTVGIPAKYGCWFDGDYANRPQWTVWDREVCDAYMANWKVKEPAVKYLAPPASTPAEYMQPADTMGRSLFFLTQVYRGFAGPGEDDTSFEEGLLMQGMAAAMLVEAQVGANSAMSALNSACADWKIP